MATTLENPIVRAARALLHRGSDGGTPIDRNGVGFNRIDYSTVRDILGDIDLTSTAADRQVFVLGRILRKYHRQLAELGFEQVELDRAAPSGRGLSAAPAELSFGGVTFEDGAGHSLNDDLEDDFPGIQPEALIPPMELILGAGGVIAQKLPGYEPRAGQIELAQKIGEAIESQESILGEAGTGVGKSLAYLIPTIYSGKRAIVSTEGKALQDQLRTKDLPFLKAVLPVPFNFAVLKGIGNYICKLKWDEEKGAQLAVGRTAEFAAVETWLESTTTGDLAEAPVNPSPELRANITTSSDECLSTDCPLYRKCFAIQARAAAKDAQIVVVNHTLLALDLELRARTDDGVSILPDRDLIVIDEAHSLESVAADAFTTEVSNWAVPRLLKGKLPIKARLRDEAMADARVANDQFFDLFFADQRSTFSIAVSEELRLRAQRLGATLAELAHQARQSLLSDDDQDFLLEEDERSSRETKKIERYAERLGNLALTFGEAISESDEHVIFVEKSTNPRSGATTTTLRRAPISVADDLRTALWEKWPVVATSATLTTQGTFAYFRQRTGCDDAQEIVVDSPFDYRRNAVIYLPQDGRAFDPSKFYQEGSIEYFERLADQIMQLLLASDGRAFCLFTSRRAMNEVHHRLAPRLTWNVYRQGDYGTQDMIRRFREDGHAVLFGLRTFWAGVDVAGDALSLVIIDKLPFPTPDEPVYQARCDKLTRDTGDKWAWFNKLAIPLCTIQFKQAFGRLIRTKSDRGVVALLDGRLTTKGYGTGIVRSLPPATQTRSLDAIRVFFSAGKTMT